MSVGTQLPADSLVFRQTANIQIAHLTPDANYNEQSYVEADVALIWPYSSSTKRISLLLAEKDIRLRKSQGQVKVTFHGSCAREVANTHVGIGDTVRLGLEGAVWTRTGDEVSTPGKKVDWDIDIGQRLRLEVNRGETVTAAIDFTAEDSPPPAIPLTTNGATVAVDAPKTNSFIDIHKTRVSSIRSSPAYRSSHRNSTSSYIDASLDPFADNAIHISGRDRKRTKFARHSGSWQLLDTEDHVSSEQDQAIPSSPLDRQGTKEFHTGLAADAGSDGIVEQPDAEETTGAADESPPGPAERSRADDLETDNPNATILTVSDNATVINPKASDLMAPPLIPSASGRHDGHHPKHQPLELPTQALTPVLRPLYSPELSLVSPLIERHGLTSGYFPSSTSSQSEIDANNHLLSQQHLVIDEASTLTRMETDVTAGGPQTESTNHAIELPEEPNLGLPERSPVVTADSIEVPQLGTGEIVSELLQDAIFARDANEIDENVLAPNTFSSLDIDLNALQQQIEHANQQLPDVADDRDFEDEDMYGPPVGQGLPLSPQQQAVTAGMIEEEVVNDINMPSPGQTKLTVASLEDQTESSTDSESEIVSDKDDLVREVLVIESSSEEDDEDEEEEEEEEDQEEEASDEDLEEASTSKESSVADHAASEAGESDGEDLNDESIEVDPATDALTQKAVEALQISRSHQDASNIIAAQYSESGLLSRTMQSQGITQFDGMTESYENEVVRMRLRSQMTHWNSSPGYEVEDISVAASEAPELTAADADDSNNLEESHLELMPADVVNDTYHATSHTGLNEAEGEESAIDVSTVDLRSLMTGDSVQHVSQNMVGAQLITPDATQQDETLKTSQTVLPANQQQTLPLSPLLTQDRLKTSSPPHSNRDRPDQSGTKSVDMALSDASPNVNDPRPRFSQRLARKSFTGENISTEYFTPRRSTRLAQSSPTFIPESSSVSQLPVSPPRTTRVLRSSSPILTRQPESVTTRLSKTQRGTTTHLSYYPHLSTLHEHFNSAVDVIAVCSADSSQAQKAKSGPHDYHTTICLADQSFADTNTTVIAQIFRPERGALPTARRGDIVLLRNMKVQTNDHKTMLLSTNSSSWAVFKRTADKSFESTMTGPPVEYDDLETAEVDRLWSWWHSDGAKKYPDFPSPLKQSDKAKETALPSPIITRSQRRKADKTHDLSQSNTRHGDPGHGQGNANSPIVENHSQSASFESSPPFTSHDDRAPPVPDVSSPTRPTRKRHQRAPSERSDRVIHELRDGTKYLDDHDRNRSPSVIHELRDGSSYVDE